jgi:hypothetical protein
MLIRYRNEQQADWNILQRDPGYVIIKQWVSDRLQDELFGYNFRLRQTTRKASRIPSITEPGISLIQNIISAQNLDYQSAL